MLIVQLKRLDGSPVYVSVSAVQSFAATPAADSGTKAAGGTRIIFGGNHQDVQEDPVTVAAMIAAAHTMQSISVAPSIQSPTARSMNSASELIQRAGSVADLVQGRLPKGKSDSPAKRTAAARAKRTSKIVGKASRRSPLSSIAPNPDRPGTKTR